MEFRHELIIAIVDEGYSELVMDTAKECGARGGTVVHAKGTANKDAERYFNIAIQPNKEMVMILVRTAIRDSILHALYTKVGLKTEAHGITFSLPVDNTVGLSKKMPVAPEEEQKAYHAEAHNHEEGAPVAVQTARETTVAPTLAADATDAIAASETTTESEEATQTIATQSTAPTAPNGDH